LSTYGGTCTPTCGVSALATAMPPLGRPNGVPSGKNTKGAISTLTYGVNPCYTYSTTFTTVVSNFTMTDAGVVCSVTLRDNRVFVLSGQQWTTAPTFNIPANCSCKGAADIWILVDHSSSISDSEMASFKNTFVIPFLNKLAISPTEINVGMSWFNLGTGLNFPLTGSRGDIDSGMNAWFTNCSDYGRDKPAGCQFAATATATAIMGFQPGSSTNNPQSSCTRYNTVNSAGYNGNPTARIIGATEWFTAQANRKVPRLFITLTDGAMNRRLVPFDSGTGCGSRSCTFGGCDTGPANGGYDLTRAVNYLRTQTAIDNPGQPLTLVSVGIGSACTNDANNCLSPQHLATLAGNNTANVLNIASFNADALANAVNNLVLLSCPAENNQQSAQCIGTCCGLCVCGVCKKPESCAPNTNICTKVTLGDFCCDASTVGVANPCGTPANQCNKTFCNASLNNGKGLCTWGSIDCSGATNGCERRNCNPSTGQCTVPDRSNCPPIDCTYGEWDQWTTCPVSCGGAQQTRTRQINRTAADGGAACPPNLANETRNCNTQCCAIPCSWTVWGGFSQCTATCGGGQQTRTRTMTPPVCGGTTCPEPNSETVDCNTQCCPKACVWSNWGNYDTCTKTCGTGTQTRTRTKVPEECGGTPCDGATSETANCATTPCPVPCVGAWTEWATFCPCNGTGLTSTVSRYYTITTPASTNPAGTPCPFNDGTQQNRTCNTPICDGGTRNCIGRNVTTPCSCAVQFRTRTYFIDQKPSGPGAIPCPETPGLKETIPCNCTEGSVDDCKCPINCRSNFTEWGECSCITFQQNRTYIIYKNASFGGINCTYPRNNTFLNQSCVPICPVPCIGSFVAGPCNCTSRRRVQRYTITQAARDGGAACPFADGFQQSLSCTAAQNATCPTPCEGQWTAWSVCNCDFGNQTRTFRITKNATNGGAPCIRTNNTIANQVCTPNASACPVVPPKCVTAAQCDDGNKCTLDRCVLQPSGVSRCNWAQAVVCNDSSVCTVDTCDPLKGCLFTTNVFCNDNSVCTNESCHPIKGCQYTKKICPDQDICFLGSCHPVQGCGTIGRPCNKTDNCTVGQCDVNYTKNGRTGPCYEDFICPFNFGLIAGISAGAAVAIAVAAAVVTLAVVGGGSYALASQMTQDDDTIITKNPMFQAKGVSGTNPVHLD